VSCSFAKADDSHGILALDFVGRDAHVDGVMLINLLERNMKTRHFAMVLAALAFGAMIGPSTAAQAPRPTADYCLINEESGSQCGFTSYAQCMQSAVGTGADCSVDVENEGNRARFRARL
jgi:hypothetical protein